MKLVAQRVLKAQVESQANVCGSIGRGILLYVCLERGDAQSALEQAARKVSKLRIFEDDKGKMNLNIGQIKGKILSVSQFTLSWSGQKGNRPSFEESMPPKEAKPMWELFNQKMREAGLQVETGLFGADMKVASVNDGPVTFHLSF